jgi:hypothetical protein
MEVDIPAASVASILKEQMEWEKHSQGRGTPERLHQRYVSHY